MVCFKTLLSVCMAFILAGLTGVEQVYGADSGRTVQILCLDSEGEPVVNASVVMVIRGETIDLGLTNSTGHVSGVVAQGHYRLEVRWMKRIVYSGALTVHGDVVKSVTCNVYRLLVKVNYLSLIPIVNVKVSVIDLETGRLVLSVDGLKVPYGFYRFSAEAELKLPEGEYEVAVNALNSKRRTIILKGNTTILFTNVISIDAILLIALSSAAVAFFTAFILTGRRGGKA